MKYLRVILLFTVIASTANQSNGQVNLDSLWAVWGNPEHDNIARCEALVVISKDIYLYSKPDSAFLLAQLLFDFADEADEEYYMIEALNIQGASYYVKGNIQSALEYYNAALEQAITYSNDKMESKLLNNLGLIYHDLGEYDKASKYYQKSISIDWLLQDSLGVAISYNNIANLCKDQGELKLAMEYYKKSMELRIVLNDVRGQAYSLNNIGLVYKEQGDYVNAITYFINSLQLNERIENLEGVAICNNNIAMVNSEMNEYHSAIEYYEKAIEAYVTLNNELSMAFVLGNIGNVYSRMGDNEVALEYYFKGLSICSGAKHLKGVSTLQNNIGQAYAAQGKLDSALTYYTNSLEIREHIGDLVGVSGSLNNIAIVFRLRGSYSDAILYSEKAIKIALESGSIENIKNAAENLYKVYRELGEYSVALKNYELYITMRDSIASEENQKEIIRQEYKYEYDKQSLADSLAFAQQQELDALNHQAELDKEAQQRYALYGGLGFLLVLGGMAFRGYQRKKKDNTLITEQKKEVELQKHLVEEKNTEILDSITYAKRIQEAILPPTRLVKEWLPNSFVLYKPKDIVAGDFYWMEAVDGHSIGQQNADNTIIFAAADCTGHGVPGAMVSVVCHNAMNRAVREFGLIQPGAILDKTRELVIEQFEKSDEDVKDGMDIALCSLTGTTLHYAGAHNPLWIVTTPKRHAELVSASIGNKTLKQAQDDTQCIIEIKATKQPIGKIDNPQPFTNHTIELQPNDAFYIFSDGFVDQFGGQKGKKFKAKAFRELLLSIQDRNMEEQRMLINEEFEQWRGDLEQVDDVCVIGVKI